MSLTAFARAVLVVSITAALVVTTAAWQLGASPALCAATIVALCSLAGMLVPPSATERLLARLSPRLVDISKPRR